MNIIWILTEMSIMKQPQVENGNKRAWNGRKRENEEKAKGADKKRELSAPST